jgi:asparagine synthase (glutamine-hydrolysing)
MDIVFHNREAGWSRSNGTWVRGSILIGDEHLSADAVDRIFTGKEELVEVVEALGKLNGHYVIVHEDVGGIYAAVDRVRSYPLFYGRGESGVYISDDPFWVQEQLGDMSIDQAARRELLQTGYVTGDRTLSPVVQQVRSGEIVHLSDDDARSARAIYQEYIPTANRSNDVEARLNELQKALDHSFGRLIDRASGRTIVVPLSGGYDSRLVVLMLKRLGYENLVAFSYGRQGSAEAEVSRSMASALGIRWEFVEYTNEKWFEWYRSPEYLEYSCQASGLTSTPHLQDYPAIMTLKKNRLVPEDSIIVPGHTVALAVVPELEGDLHRVELAVDDIVERHYIISGSPLDDPATLAEVRARVAGELGDLTRYDDRISAVESWDFSNRQSRLIVNSVRVYESWGYDWWLPLEDLELMDLWCSLPAELRKDKNLIKLLVDRLGKEMKADVPFFRRSSSTAAPKGVVSFILRHKVIAKLVGIPYYRRRKKELYREHPQAYFGVIPWKRYRKEFTGRESINYYHALCFMERLMSGCGRGQRSYLDRGAISARGQANVVKEDMTTRASLRSRDIGVRGRASSAASEDEAVMTPLVEQSGSA